jgi:medium-chain acyl-[acyl-carrier-protein] hydrolase
MTHAPAGLDPVTSRWFHIPRLIADPRLRLLCFPYAGGAAHVFHTWPAGLPRDVEVCAVQLPGRAFRFGEPCIARMEPLIEAIDAAAIPLMDRPFALFGHSMGALLAFELARRLRRRGGPRPAQLVVSGYRAPQLPAPLPPLHTLPAGVFVPELRRRHGAPDNALDDPEILELVLPALRADFEIIETYAYAPEEPLDIPLTALGGHDDAGVPVAHLAAWAEQTRSAFEVSVFPGGHFFLHSAQPELMSRLAYVLRYPVDGMSFP